MRILRTGIKIFTGFLFCVCIGVFALIITLKNTTESQYKIYPNKEFHIDAPVPVTAVANGEKYEKNLQKSGNTYKVSLKMFGIIPFSDAEVKVVNSKSVALLGTPFGMKLYTDGVLVSKIEGVETENGKKYPAKQSDIRVGDYIKSVEGNLIFENEELSDYVASSNGNELRITIVRKGKEILKFVKPVKEKSTGKYHIGLWVKDSTAGIGTLTFYNPENNIICGLGHGVCDEETDNILSLNDGEMVSADILGIKKGKDGTPGELKGAFINKVISEEVVNNKCGVYGRVMGDIDFKNLIQIASKQEVKDGYAQILSTVNGTKAKLFSCKINIRKGKFNSKTHNLIVKVTDKELIAKTGGIVQGMSGSPLIQNGKLIGAITHVLVDDPTTGYAIFAENMLETAQTLANKGEIKDAS